MFGKEARGLAALTHSCPHLKIPSCLTDPLIRSEALGGAALVVALVASVAAWGPLSIFLVMPAIVVLSWPIAAYLLGRRDGTRRE
jgi:hypothetical protein